MKPEQQRIKIAEACGWTQLEERAIDVGGYSVLALSGIKPPMRGWMAVPDYCNSLDAMHEAEKVLDNPDIYECRLARVLCGEEYIWHATAAQRAEAFLRTLNLWMEDGE